MNYKKLFNLAQEKGITDLELYISKNRKLVISMYHKNVESYNVSDNEVMSARGIYNGKMGYVFCEKLTNDSFDFIIDSIIKNANIIEENKKVDIFAGSEKYRKYKTYNDSFDLVPASEKIKKMIETEDFAAKLDDRVEISGSNYEEEETKVTIMNSKGLNLSQRSVVAIYFMEAVAKENDDIKTSFEYQLMGNYQEFDPISVAKKTVYGALSKLHAEPVKSKKYKILMDSKVLASMINALMGSVSGDAVNKQKSKLVGKLNSKIASSKVTLIENPLVKEYPFFYRFFDDEGVATYKKKIIDKGVLKTFLYNLESSAQAHCKSTGNGYKNGALGTVGTSTAFLKLLPGKKTKEELINKVKNGLQICDVQGLHAGMDALSGNFSLQASGYLIEDGKISKPVNLITIAGNLFKLFEDIIEVGNDSFVTYSGIDCPSVIIKSLVVSGK